MPVMAAGSHHAVGATTAVDVCAAVLGVVGGLALAIASGVLRAPALRAQPRLAPAGIATTVASTLPRARAGPIFLCVIRR